jgi:lambda family phage portal protein
MTEPLNLIDRIVMAISPRWGAERLSWRAAAREISSRNYTGADRGRTMAEWRTTGASADLEIWRDQKLLRDRSRDLIRNNPYAAAAIRQLGANLVGPGIKAKAQHSSPRVAKQAQAIWDAWATSRVDGVNRFSTLQLLAVRGAIEAGDSLIIWTPDKNGPDARAHVLEGDFLDQTVNRLLDDGGRIVSGVEIDKDGNRVGYWIYNNHPGDILGGYSVSTDGSAIATGLAGSFSRRVDARDVDHVFLADRPGQNRGAPWFSAAIRKLRNVEQLEDSIQAKKRVEACLALIRETPDADSNPSPLGVTATQTDGTTWEKFYPGMVAKTLPGEKVSVVNPSSTGDGDAFHRSQMMAIAAGLGVPYHLLTGDVSQANYSSLRADTVAFWAVLDTWLEHMVLPHICEPAFARVMRRAALETGNPKLLEVTARWTPPARPWVDPLKDITAEVVEVRSGFKSMQTALAERGANVADAFAEIAEANKLADKLGLALATDPRRVDDKGGLQPATGYLLPAGQKPAAEAANPAPAPDPAANGADA